VLLTADRNAYERVRERSVQAFARLAELRALGERPVLLALVAASIAVAAVSQNGTVVEVVLDTAVGAVFLACGVLLWRGGRDRVGNLMLATAIGWFLGGVLHRGPLAHLLLSFPGGGLSTTAAVLVVAAYLDGVVESLVHSDLLTLLFSSGIAVGAGARLFAARQTGPARRLAFVASLLIAVVLGGGAVARLAGIRVTGLQVLAYEITLVIVAVALTAYLAWRGSADAVVPAFVVELGRSSSAGLRDRLAGLLGDPSLVLGFAIGDPARYVDERGQPVVLTAAPGRVMTFIEDRGTPIGVVVHDADVLADAATLRGLSAATKIALDNLRLRDEIVARTDTLEAARRRLANSADAERERLANQIEERLVSRLDRARQLLGDVHRDRHTAPEIDEVRRRLAAAGTEVRAVARGVRPAALVEKGFATAIRDLVEGIGVPVRVSLPSEPLPHAVEITTYYVCSEALTNVAKHARPSRAELTISVVQGVLRVRVADDGVGGADASGIGLDGLRARVSAAGGDLRVVSPEGAGTIIEAEIPLG
jgi:signal transduction histidine kinase